MITFCCSSFCTPPQIFGLTLSQIGEKTTITERITQDSWNNKDSAEIIGIKMALIATVAPPLLFAVRIPFRALSLCCGDFVWAGYQIAERNWRINRQIWSLDDTRNTNSLPPGVLAFCQQLAIQSLIQLAKNIVKLVTYPIAIVALAFSGLYGALIRPIEGKILVSWIEDTWSRDETCISEKNSVKTFLSGWNLMLGDFIAPCMMPRRVAIERNIYKCDVEYNNETVKAQVRKIILLLTKENLFFQNEEIEKMVDQGGKRVPELLSFFQRQLSYPGKELKTERMTKLCKIFLDALPQVITERSKITELQAHKIRNTKYDGMDVTDEHIATALGNIKTIKNKLRTSFPS